MRKLAILVVAVLALGAGTRLAGAQQAAAAPPSPPPLEVGSVAPDFTIPGATRYGVLKNPVKLSDFKGKTVVLAFFFKARTKG